MTKETALAYRNNFHERKYMEEKEIILDSLTAPKAQ